MNQTAFQTNAFQVGPALAFQIEFDADHKDARPFKRERRQTAVHRAPVSMTRKRI